MEIIHAVSRKDNYMVCDGKLSSEPIISEWGIYSTTAFDKDHDVMDDYSDVLLRSKIIISNKDSVIAGYCCLDSIYLLSI